MAVGISDKFVSENYKFPNEILNRIIIQLFWPRFIYRKTRSLFDSARAKAVSAGRCPAINFAAEDKRHFSAQGWVFIENFLPGAFHKVLCEEWPAPYHFVPMRSLMKSYDNGLVDADLVKAKRKTVLGLVSELASPRFCHELAQMTGSKTALSFGRPVFTRAYHRSSVVPHLDSVADAGMGDTVNLIYYLKGTGGTRGGGTCILSDAEGSIVFEPQNVTNSCLIYLSNKTYHGMRRMKRGSSRYMVACDFWPQEAKREHHG